MKETENRQKIFSTTGFEQRKFQIGPLFRRLVLACLLFSFKKEKILLKLRLAFFRDLVQIKVSSIFGKVFADSRS